MERKPKLKLLHIIVMSVLIAAMNSSCGYSEELAVVKERCQDYLNNRYDFKTEVIAVYVNDTLSNDEKTFYTIRAKRIDTGEEFSVQGGGQGDSIDDSYFLEYWRKKLQTDLTSMIQGIYNKDSHANVKIPGANSSDFLDYRDSIPPYDVYIERSVHYENDCIFFIAKPYVQSEDDEKMMSIIEDLRKNKYVFDKLTIYYDENIKPIGEKNEFDFNVAEMNKIMETKDVGLIQKYRDW